MQVVQWKNNISILQGCAVGLGGMSLEHPLRGSQDLPGGGRDVWDLEASSAQVQERRFRSASTELQSQS